MHFSGVFLVDCKLRHIALDSLVALTIIFHSTAFRMSAKRVQRKDKVMTTVGEVSTNLVES